jgi:type I restriction enzyme S subunit
MPRYKFKDIAVNSTLKKKPTEADKDTYLGLEHLDSGSLTVTRFGSEVAPIGEKLIMKKGDVLFGKRRAYQKKVAIAPFDGIFSAHGMVLRPQTDVVIENFFPLFVASDYFLEAAIKISVGSLSPTINWGTLKELEFNLPSLDEQRMLAEVLWSMIDTKNAYKRLIFMTEQLVKSRFVEMFGDPVRNEKWWTTKPIKDFATVKIGPFGSLLHAGDYIENGVPLVNPSHIVDGEIVIDLKLTLTTKKFSEMSAYALQAGDVVLGRRGEIGRCAVVNEGEYLCGTGCMFIRIERDYLPMMLQRIISSDAMRHVLENMAVGVTMMNLNAGMIANLEVIMPPLALQNRFASFVQAADKSKFELACTFDELDAAYKALVRERLG